MKLRPLTSAAPQAQLPDASFRIHDRLAIEARDITTVPQTPVTTDYAAVKILNVAECPKTASIRP